MNIAKPLKAKKLRNKNKNTVVDYVFLVILAVIGLLMIYPLWWVVMTSVSEPVWLSTNVVKFLPLKFDLNAYKFILGESKLWQAYGNSIYYAALSTIISVAVCSMYAYPLTIPEVKGKKFFNLLIVIPMFFSGGMIPLYMQVANLGLLNTVWALVLPGAVSTYYIILFRTQFKSIPMELRESARIDGASELRIFWNIILPLSKVIFLIICLYCIVGSWNSFTPPLLYLNDDTKMPLSIYLRNLVVTNTTDSAELSWSAGNSYYQTIAAQGGGIGMRVAIKMGTIVVSVIPIMMIYPFIQRHFVKGVMLGSVKG